MIDDALGVKSILSHHCRMHQQCQQVNNNNHNNHNNNNNSSNNNNNNNNNKQQRISNRTSSYFRTHHTTPHHTTPHHTTIIKMSLKGRYVIDRLKAAISHRFTLPVPAYGSSAYWDKAYEQLGPHESHEWGNFSLNDFLRFHTYKLVWEGGKKTSQSQLQSQPPTLSPSSQTISSSTTTTTTTTTFAESIQVHPSDKHKSIMMLGCGNSTFGDEMLQPYYENENKYKYVPSDEEEHGDSSSSPEPLLDLTAMTGAWQGPLYQVDVSSHVIETSTQRYHRQTTTTTANTNTTTLGEQKDGVEHDHHNNDNDNNDKTTTTSFFIQDDATSLSAFETATMNAVVDKGLIDAFFCADEYTQIQQVMQSVHRVLQPQGIFVTFSFSSPQYLLPQLLLMPENEEIKHEQQKQLEGRYDSPPPPTKSNPPPTPWQNIQVREIESRVHMYRFQKGRHNEHKDTRSPQQHQQQQRGRKVRRKR